MIVLGWDDEGGIPPHGANPIPRARCPIQGHPELHVAAIEGNATTKRVHLPRNYSAWFLLPNASVSSRLPRQERYR